MGDRLEKNSAAVRKRIESHAFSDEAGDEYEGSEFGGFGDYFRRKKVKLQNLDVELRASAGDKQQIFKGVVAHVTGYTQPPLHVLHKELVQHGAGFLQYLDSKTMATHIIASSMPPRKTIDFSKYRIVKPAWVTDSIQAGRLLPWTDYRVINDGPRQKTIQLDGGRLLSQSVQQSPRGYREQTQNSFYMSQFQKPTGGNSPYQPPSASKPHALADRIEDADEMDIDLPAKVKPSHVDIEDEYNQAWNQRHDFKKLQDVPLSHPAPHPDKPPILPPKITLKTKPMTSEEHNAQLLSDPHIRKSSTANPDFLKQYYSESRLHHLSTWKTQLKSRMQALAAERGSSQKGVLKSKPGLRRYIMHVDFDSFFCAVSLKRAPPELRDKPAVVAHGGAAGGSEIASCNYPARKFGVRNGMWMKRALELCPDLKVLPYDFPAYEEASQQFYDCVLDVGGVVQSVSIDEALVDVSSVVLAAAGSKGVGVSEGSIWREQEKVDEIASRLRAQVKEKTGCHVSVGIGGNILLAKVALRKAKPAGQYQIRPEEVLSIMGELKVDDLPGVAYNIGGRLEEIGIKFVKDLRETTKEKLVSTLGPKTGEKLWEYARGIDRVEVGEQPIRKSVSADVNWGIRFINQEEAEEFVRNLAKELERRLLNEGVKGKHLSMKIMRRALDAPLDPPKHLGHGKCDTFNKSAAFGVATNSWELIGKEAVAILRSYQFSPGDLRGLGLQMTKLEPLKQSTNSAPDGSQKKLSFGNVSAVSKRRSELVVDENNNSSKRFKPASSENDEDPITDDPLTPRKPRVHPALALSRANAADELARTPLNISGTQFLIPTHPDPEVLAELPQDIRSKLLNQAAAKRAASASTSAAHSREASPAVGPLKSRSNSPGLTDDIPSDIDREVFDALPEDMKAEVLASYGHRNRGPGAGQRAQTVLPQSPRKNRIVRSGLPKEKNSPSKRGGAGGGIKSLFGGGRGLARDNKERRADAGAGLMQTSFAAASDVRRDLHNNTDSERDDGNHAETGAEISPVDDDLDPEFLAELPEDVRREVVEEHRRAARLAAAQKKSRLRYNKAPATTTTRNEPGSSTRAPLAGQQQQQQKLVFPPPPPKMAFTKSGTTSLAEVKGMMTAWHKETARRGPHRGDVEMLEKYLVGVVVEERDMEKARVLIKWMEWIVEEEGPGEKEGDDWDGKRLWREAVVSLKGAVDEGMRRRGLGGMEF